jgi:hypothetical protein
MKRTLRAVITAAVVLTTLAVAGCAAAGGPAAPARQPVTGSRVPLVTEVAPFVGYKWLVTSIRSHRKQTPIPGSDQVDVVFAWNGQFGADGPINYTQGTYHLVVGGFTISGIMGTLNGYAGNNQAVIVAIRAIDAFNDGTHANATVTTNKLVISVGGFRLNCQRDGIAPVSLS